MLTNIAKILYETDIRAAYTYANKALGLNEPIGLTKGISLVANKSIECKEIIKSMPPISVAHLTIRK